VTDKGGGREKEAGHIRGYVHDKGEDGHKKGIGKEEPKEVWWT